MLIDTEFQETVLIHIIKNNLKNISTVPLYLAIHGPKGEGKTYLSHKICERYSFHIFSISASMLSGKHEGDAVEALQKTYINASNHQNISKKLSVIIIDDFHLSIVSKFENTEVAINSQLLTGFMMNLSENHKICGEDVVRVPIILLGNDFSKIHSPLTRHGRMNFFEWKPSLEQKTGIIESLLRPLIIEKEQAKIKDLVASYYQFPIAFFSELKNDLTDYSILNYIRNSNNVSLSEIQYFLDSEKIKYKIEFLYELAEKRSRTKLVEYESF